jgi:hypothetical protein
MLKILYMYGRQNEDNIEMPESLRYSFQRRLLIPQRPGVV